MRRVGETGRLRRIGQGGTLRKELHRLREAQPEQIGPKREPRAFDEQVACSAARQTDVGRRFLEAQRLVEARGRPSRHLAHARLRPLVALAVRNERGQEGASEPGQLGRNRSGRVEIGEQARAELGQVRRGDGDQALVRKESALQGAAIPAVGIDEQVSDDSFGRLEGVLRIGSDRRNSAAHGPVSSLEREATAQCQRHLHGMVRMWSSLRIPPLTRPRAKNPKAGPFPGNDATVSPRDHPLRSLQSFRSASEARCNARAVPASAGSRAHEGVRPKPGVKS